MDYNATTVAKQMLHIKGVSDLPPKHKFTKDEIIAAALNIVRRDGLSGVTARSLGAELGSSSHPIFSIFKNMEEVQQEIVRAVQRLYNRYVDEGLSEEIAFKGTGMKYIQFACDEPQLFALMFMTQDSAEHTLDEILAADENNDRILEAIQKLYGLSREDAHNLHKTMWIFTHGLACLCATGVSRLTEKETSELLTDVFTGQIIKIKSKEGKA